MSDGNTPVPNQTQLLVGGINEMGHYRMVCQESKVVINCSVVVILRISSPDNFHLTNILGNMGVDRHVKLFGQLPQSL